MDRPEEQQGPSPAGHTPAQEPPVTLPPVEVPENVLAELDLEEQTPKTDSLVRPGAEDFVPEDVLLERYRAAREAEEDERRLRAGEWVPEDLDER